MTKLDSGIAPTLRLRRTPKLLDSLRARSRHAGVRFVAFKLTQAADDAAVRTAVAGLFASASADFVVHNDLATRENAEAFPAPIWDSTGAQLAACADRGALAAALEQLLMAERVSVIDAVPVSPATAATSLSRASA